MAIDMNELKNLFQGGSGELQGPGESGIREVSGSELSPVGVEELPDGQAREYVEYTSPESGEVVRVYGNWNEYAVSEDEEGNMLLPPDAVFPIKESTSERGEMVLDELEQHLGEMDAEQGTDPDEEQLEDVDNGTSMKELMQKLAAQKDNGDGMGSGAVPEYGHGGVFSSITPIKRRGY
jgi:hypothetical protein